MCSLKPRYQFGGTYLMMRSYLRVFTRRTFTAALTWLLLFISLHPAVATEPIWIWGKPDANKEAADDVCLFRKTFELDQPATRGILRITCDDEYIVRINGRLLGVDDNWQHIEQYDVTSLLKSGTNQFFIRGRNLDGPAGLLVHLDVTLKNSRQIEIVSDDTWDASVQKRGTWNPDAVKEKSWRPAFTSGPQSTTAPWSDDLALNEQISVFPARAGEREKFELREADRVLFLGNTVIEREQRYGFWEAALTTHYADRHIVFRNLGWSGDTVLGEARARFGTPADGFDHLEVHVHAVKPTVILCGYGSNAIFAGPAGLQPFIDGYNRLLDSLETTGASIVLLAPLQHEPVDGRLLAPSYNANRPAYVAAIRKLAAERNCRFAEIDQPADQQLTDNGVHLTEQGYLATAPMLLKALGLTPHRHESFDEKLITAIREKNELYFHRWRPQNETYLYLFRKHEQGNNAVEIPMFDPLVADAERKIDELKKEAQQP